jgi:hypothetical protein
LTKAGHAALGGGARRRGGGRQRVGSDLDATVDGARILADQGRRDAADAVVVGGAVLGKAGGPVTSLAVEEGRLGALGRAGSRRAAGQAPRSGQGERGGGQGPQ